MTSPDTSSSPAQSTPPSLTLVPTPIGNLADITLRALDTLKSVDLIACEDTRHSRRLLQHYEIDKPLTALHDHNESQRSPELIERMLNGETIALISDAGTPCLSDPGYRLHQAAIDAQLTTTVLPGASAITTALVGSGFPPYPFSFHGFLQVKKGKRRSQLTAALESTDTTLFFESPHRLPSTLEILNEIAPEIQICIAREISKAFETYHRDSASALFTYFSERKAKGEIVLLIPPAPKSSKTREKKKKEKRKKLNESPPS